MVLAFGVDRGFPAMELLGLGEMTANSEESNHEGLLPGGLAGYLRALSAEVPWTWSLELWLATSLITFLNGNVGRDAACFRDDLDGTVDMTD